MGTPRASLSGLSLDAALHGASGGWLHCVGARGPVAVLLPCRARQQVGRLIDLDGGTGGVQSRAFNDMGTLADSLA